MLRHTQIFRECLSIFSPHAYHHARETPAYGVKARCDKGSDTDLVEATYAEQLNIMTAQVGHVDPDVTKGQTGKEDAPAESQRKAQYE